MGLGQGYLFFFFFLQGAVNVEGGVEFTFMDKVIGLR